MHLRCVVSQVEAEQPQEDPEATPKRPGRRGRPSKAAATEDPGEEIFCFKEVSLKLEQS